MGETDGMRLIRHVVVFDAADVAAESAFWAGMLGGRVVDDDEAFHCVIDHDGRWQVGVQFAPDHEQPEWPHGRRQQVHLDLHVEDAAAADELARRLGARVLQPAADLADAEGHQVYADPAGHPFCIGWGHPTDDALRRYVAALDAAGS